MQEYEVEIVTELDEVEIIYVMAGSAIEAERLATELVEQGKTDLYGREVISAIVL